MVWPIILDGVDDGTIELIAELQRDDIQKINHHTKGKQREGDLSDFELALQLCHTELIQLETNHRDRLMAQSIAAAVFNDSILINDLSEQEAQAQEDHHYALRIHEHPTNEPPSNHNPENDESMDEEMGARILTREFANLYGLRAAPWNKVDTPVAESSKWAASRKPANAATSGVCVACRDEKAWFDIAKAPCGDSYCDDCLSTLFHNSMTDESLYPPRCCSQIIPFQLVRSFLASDVSKAFGAKELEMDTKDKTYCFATYCATFIPPKNIVNDTGTCPSCSRATCTICKATAHGGDCPKDAALQSLIEAAQAEGWQRCYSCRRMVELDMGCNHITCLCRAQFCYVCGQQWKTCSCETWEENRLYGRAVNIAARAANPRRQLYGPPRDILDEEQDVLVEDEMIVVTAPIAQVHELDHHNGPPTPNALGLARENLPLDVLPEEEPDLYNDGNTRASPPVRVPTPVQVIDLAAARGVDQIMRDLRANHECVHRKWIHIKGPHRCEECFHTLPHYIFECRQCELQACWRCRRNRL